MTLHPISGKSYLLLFALLLISAFSPAQTAVPVVLAPVPQLQFFDASGRPLSFGCVSSFQSQTTTPLATYTDFTGQVQNQNPVLLNAGGSANIWLQSGQAYSLVVKSFGGNNCALGQTLYTVDGVGGGASQLNTVVTPSGGSAAFTVQSQNQLFTLTLTANTAGQPVTFVGATAPALITFQITEDGAGAHTFSWPSNLIGAAPIDTTALHTTSQTFIWNGTTIMPVGSGFSSAGNTLIGNAVATSLNNVIYVDGSKYPFTSAGIQAAMAVLPGTGGIVMLPPGNYSLSSTIVITTPNVTLQGYGASMSSAGGGTTLTWTGGASEVISNQASGTVLRGFNLNNTGTATVGVSLVGGGGFYKVTLEDISITTPTVQFSVAGVQTTTAGRVAWLTMRHCWIQQAAPIGADIDVTNLFVSDNSTFWGNNTNIRVGHTSTVFSFQFVNGSDSELIAANGNTGIGIDIQSAESLNIRDSYFEGNGDATAGQEGQLPIKIAGASGFIDIEGNYIQGNSHTNYAIKIGGTPIVVSIKNNDFRNFITGGIDNTGGTATLIELAQNGVPGITPTVINGLTGVAFYLDTTGRLNGVTFGKGIGADGSGYKHKRFGATCSTGATTGNTCTTTYSWTTAFADASYTPVCTPVGPTQLGIFSINSFNASGVTILIDTATNAVASYSGVDCVAVHD